MHFSKMQGQPNLTPVEQEFVRESQRQKYYASEHIPGVIEVSNVAALGKLVSLRFLEWVSEHPAGVVSLPTGRTPEMFIAYLKHFRQNWKESSAQVELKLYGLGGLACFPDTSQLKFVQLDEFFPMHPDHKTSFTHYVRNLYFPLLDLKPENILTMDFVSAGVLPDDHNACASIFENGIVNVDLLRPAMADEEVEKRDEDRNDRWNAATDDKAVKDKKYDVQVAILAKAHSFAKKYEAQVRAWGGIGFWVGGIGPDGHIAFNMPGSSHNSQTRIVTLNYPTAAAASGDLGGIEFSRHKAALTIGLDTITFNKDAALIVMAAGEGKARVVAEAIESQPSTEIPATCLQSHPGARFYVSSGAASLLKERRTETLHRKIMERSLLDTDVDSTLVDLALRLNKRLVDLSEEDVGQDSRGALFLRPSTRKGPHASLQTLVEGTVRRLEGKISRGTVLARGRRILHTAPHHDDIMLSYHAALPDLMATNTHRFAYLTSGFHAVTNGYMLSILRPPHEDAAFLRERASLIFETPYPRVVEAFVAAHRERNTCLEAELESVLCLRQMSAIWEVTKVEALQQEVAGVVAFLTQQLPGDKSPVKIQLLKGAMRETEADRMWALRGVDPSQVKHLRSAFYTDDFFTPLPTIEEDAMPMVRMLEDFKPDIVTVAFDPEGTGPDTHYKVLQVVAQATRMYESADEMESVARSPSGLTVWGYRNVWFRFHMAEATVMAPVNDAGLAEMNDAFLTCFSTQKSASFPAPDYDGPFSHWSEASQRAQRQQLGVVLGEDFFVTHPDASVRASSGYVFLKEMDRDAFSKTATQLRGRMESDRGM